jgi:hypothetical protein
MRLARAVNRKPSWVALQAKPLGRSDFSRRCQCADYGFFRFSEHYVQTVLAAEAAVIAITQTPDLFHNGGAGAGQSNDLAAL